MFSSPPASRDISSYSASTASAQPRSSLGADQLEGGAQRDRRLGRELPRHRARLVQDAVLDEPQRQPAGDRVLRAEPLAAEQVPRGGLCADRRGERRARGCLGRHAQRHERRLEPGGGGHEHHLAPGQHREAEPDRHPVHRSDERQRAVRERPHQAPESTVGLTVARIGELGEVLADAERPADAAEQHDPGPGCLGSIERVAGAVPHLDRHRVERLGPVPADRPDAVARVLDQHLGCSGWFVVGARCVAHMHSSGASGAASSVPTAPVVDGRRSQRAREAWRSPSTDRRLSPYSLHATATHPPRSP